MYFEIAILTKLVIDYDWIKSQLLLFKLIISIVNSILKK